MKPIQITIPLKDEAATALQGYGNATITRRETGKEYDYYILAGTIRRALVAKDGSEIIKISMDEPIPDMSPFQIEITKEVPDALEGKPAFEYNGKWFVGAGTFKANGIPTDFKSLSRRLIHKDTDHDWSDVMFRYKASRAGYLEDDIFYCLNPLRPADDCYVCPGSNELFKFAR